MARSQVDGRLSLHGRQLMVAEAGNLVSFGNPISKPCVNATVAIGAEAGDARTITIQLLDAEGRDLDHVEFFDMMVMSNAEGTAFSGGGSTGVAIGTDGALLALVAKQVFRCTCEADGDWDGTYTDTGTTASYLHIRLPNGRVIVSAAMTNA